MPVTDISSPPRDIRHDAASFDGWPPRFIDISLRLAYTPLITDAFDLLRWSDTPPAPLAD